MRRAVATAVLLALVPLAPQGASAADRGTIRGRVVNETTGNPQAGVAVTLTSGTSQETASVVGTTRSDARGRYVFENLTTGADRFYALDGRYEDGLFSGDAISLPDDTDEEPVIDSTLRVWETTRNPSAILVARDSMFLNVREATVAVVESITIANMSERAYIGRGDEESAARSSIGFALPQRANEDSIAIVDADLNIPELVPTDFGFGVTAAIPPGEVRVTFSYTVSGTAAAYDLSRQALYPTAKVSVYAAPPLDVRSNRLIEADVVEVGEQTYREHTSESGLDAGDALQVVAIAEAGMPRSLLYGMAGLLALVLALGLLPLLRRRRSEVDEPPEPDERDDLLTEIAELDLKRDRGDLDEDVWAARRAELKARLLGDEAARSPASGRERGVRPDGSEEEI